MNSEVSAEGSADSSTRLPGATLPSPQTTASEKIPTPTEDSTERPTPTLLPGSEGEHRLQLKYATRTRATNFYEKQMLDYLAPKMIEFIGLQEFLITINAPIRYLRTQGQTPDGVLKYGSTVGPPPRQALNSDAAAKWQTKQPWSRKSRTFSLSAPTFSASAQSGARSSGKNVLMARSRRP